jgi:hypothetical protein
VGHGVLNCGCSSSTNSLTIEVLGRSVPALLIISAYGHRICHQKQQYAGLLPAHATIQQHLISIVDRVRVRLVSCIAILLESFFAETGFSGGKLVADPQGSRKAILAVNDSEPGGEDTKFADLTLPHTGRRCSFVRGSPPSAFHIEVPL